MPVFSSRSTLVRAGCKFEYGKQIPIMIRVMMAF